MPVMHQLSGFVLEIIVDEPERRNPLSPEVVDGIRRGLGRVRVDDIRAVVIRSTGSSVFIAGADLSTLRNGARELLAMNLFGLFEEIENCEVPVICAVQGKALGGGFEIAIVSDLVLASPDAEFGLPETTLGIAPGIAMVRLHREIGRHRTLELSFTNRRLSATEALELGIVNSIVDPDSLSDAAVELARSIAARAPLGVRATKRAVNRDLGGDDWAHVRASMEALFRTRDLTEGLDAFEERRSPMFLGY